MVNCMNCNLSKKNLQFLDRCGYRLLLLNSTMVILKLHQFSSCGLVGRAVASSTRGPLFESSHRQNFNIEHLFPVNYKEKTKIKKKRPRMAHLISLFLYSLSAIYLLILNHREDLKHQTHPKESRPWKALPEKIWYTRRGSCP